MAGAAHAFGVNVLINNAGIGAFGLLESQPWPTIERVLATDLVAPIHLTHALLPGSPAIDAAADAACPATDQRGVARPQGAHCDVGAFERELP